MNKSKLESIDVLDELIVGRVDPYIYAFKTNTIPNYLKIGDTYRPVSQRLNEWKKLFPELEKQYENKALIDEENYFRDYSIHQYLEKDLHKIRLVPGDLEDEIYYSREFFKNTEVTDIDDAIKDIKMNFDNNTGKYDYYTSSNKLPQIYHFKRGDDWELRPNQRYVVNNFVKAISTGRKNLLMYAVMRFGKSFTSLCCALEMKAKLVLVLSAKADVKDEWKKTVESAGNFKEYEFLDSEDLLRNANSINDSFSRNKKVVLFLTLQDLQGESIKEKHRTLFNTQIDLLIVDETHFGARAESFGRIIKNAGYDLKDEKNINKLNDDAIDLKSADEDIKKINAKIRLHLSGTPYRILMGSEFEKEDIISFVQFSDIVKEQKKWDEENLHKDETNEWENPYYGFPQMVRFAFNPNKSSRKKMEELKKSGVSFAFSKLFEPRSITFDKKYNSHKQFINQKEILDLLQVIDGTKEDDNLLGFLDYDKIKEGKMCRHMVMVLPYCASCDAMEELIKNNKIIFKNLNTYEIVNISGLEASKLYKSPNVIKNKIKEFENKNKKTITLTVNRMLTGSTVEQWDTMLYFKDTASPQEYDQSIFRLQNQYTRTFTSKNGIIKENLKPQTLLVDFDPNRLFKMQEQKSLIYNVNTEKNGNSKLRERLEEEIRISPIITMNHNKIKKVTATNILDAISEYNNKRSVSEEVLEIPVDLSLLDDGSIREVIERQGEFNSKQGLIINPIEGEGEDLEVDTPGDDKNTSNKEKVIKDYSDSKTDKEVKKLENQIKTYYQRILFYSFLTKNEVSSLDDILKTIGSEDNTRLAKNLYLDKDILEKVSEYMDPFKRSRLDYKIQNISMLANDETLTPIERAMTSIKKFDRMSESEIVTPAKVCKDMINLLPKDGIQEILQNKEKFLDLGCKSGEYAVAIYNRLRRGFGISHDEIKDLIYSIPTSSIAYEFTRKFYEILDLNIENIATKFNAYDLLEIKGEDSYIDYKKIKDVLEQNRTFSKIKLDEKIKAGDKKVKFGAVVGNPPYQKTLCGTSDRQIYPEFMEIGFNLSPLTCFISPGRFLFNAGKTSKSWNKKMLNDPHLTVPLYEPLASKIFPGTGFKGGIAVTIRDEQTNFGAIGTYTSFPELNSIVKKVKASKEFISWMNDIYLQQKFDLDKLYLDYPKARLIVGSNGRERRLTTAIFQQLDVFTDAPQSETDLKILGLINNKRIWKYIPSKYIQNHPNTYKYKVLVPKSNGSGAIGETLSTPLIGEPLMGVTQSFITFGEFNTFDEAESALRYIKTKMCRVLLGSLKVTQDNNKPTWANVPLQDFTKFSDIDWSKSIAEIDKQLYKKYGLNQEEIEFIEKNVQAME
ncbi:MAG: Eco57I restriction-modification methylase domain-containing protein [Tissierellia bacterium]|nr:Eco57I restriction-modification methylase domain-containing protein [Tissierellia bacterium]